MNATNFLTIANNQQTSIHSDLSSLDAIRKQGLVDEAGAIKSAAKEFEAYFLNLMLKSMREAGDAMGENTLFGSEQEKMFVSMMDEQMAVDLSQKGSLGIAELMMEQLYRQLGISEQKISATSESANFVSGTKQITRKSGSGTLYSQAKSKGVSTISLEQGNLNYEKALKAEFKKDTVPGVDRAEKKALFSSAKDFVKNLMPYAKRAAKRLNLDPRLLLAQAALETGWGKHVVHDENGRPGFNLFGIKADSRWKGGSIRVDTLEVENAEFKKVNAAFRRYGNFEQSFQDYANFIKSNGRYQRALENTQDPAEYIQSLQDSGYATDPDYAKKIINIFNNQTIQSLDMGPQ
ncbi:flagellar assembly peptidoglycan hydrolase FlgJ [Aliikangiella sp. G2MR2-5]|uniref:flagellar assembly peptidoglycan hydrolase FlgJ n=1 Tax=Aliikangiella sp. G2MR2-5 TaxID=2788943 RepID=UPI0018A8DB2E|nr:flagellar assembly peptidoglycan hydrolase FlgJ [Aliikangiella sp. G2MR2-5]